MFQIQLKKLRDQKGVSQQEFAHEIGVAQSAVGNWESGTREPRTIEQLEKIADYFDVTIDYLLGREGSKEKPTPTDGDGLSEEQLEIVRLFKSAPPALRAAALAVLRSAEGQNSVPDAALDEEKIPHSQTKHPD